MEVNRILSSSSTKWDLIAKQELFVKKAKKDRLILIVYNFVQATKEISWLHWIVLLNCSLNQLSMVEVHQMIPLLNQGSCH